MDASYPDPRRRRARGVLGVIVVVLGALILTFFQTQVVDSPAYAMHSERNRLRPLPVPAPRGTILDRHGELVAENVPAFTVTLLPAPADSIGATLARLAPHLGLSPARVAALESWQRRHWQQPVLVSADATFDQVSVIEERRPLFPGVLIEMRPKRHYPAGRAVAHVAGYVGEIGESELNRPEFHGYRPGRIVGKTGLERQYERRLAGTDGVRYLEVDALGRIVGSYAPRRGTPARAGESLTVTLDLGLQRYLADIIPDTARAAVVALEPGTGAVLALYSSPAVDPNEFAGSISAERWAELRADTGRAMLNRAVSGLYSPASTWKLVTAAIALDLGVVEPGTRMPVACRGGMQYGNRYFRCWESRGHGALDLAAAIGRSCNVYFYQLGLKVGLARLLAEGVRLGFDQPTGVDLPAERTGHVPSEPDWYERRFGWRPTDAEVLSLAIGQGPNDQSVLKMAQFYGALATGGRASAPRLILDPERDPGAETGTPAGPHMALDLEPAHLDGLREGLRGVIREGGTAHGSALEHWDWSGKTGTAQNPHGRDHAWFVGIGGPRGGQAEIVVAVLIEEGERGADAAQVAAKAADHYLRSRHGLVQDTVQTLREHWQTGRHAPWAARWR